MALPEPGVLPKLLGGTEIYFLHGVFQHDLPQANFLPVSVVEHTFWGKGSGGEEQDVCPDVPEELCGVTAQQTVAVVAAQSSAAGEDFHLRLGQQRQNFHIVGHHRQVSPVLQGTGHKKGAGGLIEENDAAFADHCGSFSRHDLLGGETQENISERRLHFKQDIDVRGMRGEEALQAVTYYIDDAVLLSMSRVRILHGTGNGILRTLIRQYLEANPAVASCRDEHVQFGGAGITVVELH